MRVRRPVMAELVFRDQRLVEQRVEQRAALALVHALDGDRELRIDEQHLAARHGMHAHHRMKLRRILQLEVLQLLAVLLDCVEQRLERLEVVHRFEARDEAAACGR